ncbi:hypothetical protein ACEQPO_24420 [Bacillus sp. SL00103]
MITETLEVIHYYNVAPVSEQINGIDFTGDDGKSNREDDVQLI